MTKRSTRGAKVSPVEASDDSPRMAPLYPHLRCKDIGKITFIRLEPDDDDGVKRVQYWHKIIRPEMTAEDVRNVFGGEDYELFAHKTDGTMHTNPKRELHIGGPMKFPDEDDDDGGDGELRIIRGTDGNVIAVPPMKPDAQAAYIAQMERIAAAEKRNERLEKRIIEAQAKSQTNGPLEAVLAGMLQQNTALLTGMMNRNPNQQDDASRAAIRALEAQVTTLNTQLLNAQGASNAALAELRAAHLAEVSRLTAQNEKLLLDIRTNHAAEVARLKQEVDDARNGQLSAKLETIATMKTASNQSDGVAIAGLVRETVKDFKSNGAGALSPEELAGLKTAARIAPQLEAGMQKLDKLSDFADGMAEAVAANAAAQAASAQPPAQPAHDDGAAHDGDAAPAPSPTNGATNLDVLPG